MAMSRWSFVCKNEKCEHKNDGFVFLCPWPLGEIDRVINSTKVSKDPSFKTQLEEVKKLGKKYVCIQYPSEESIPVVGYRVHLWCDDCARLSEFDVMLSDSDKEKMEKENLCANDKDIVKSSMDNAGLPKECPVCKNKLIGHNEIHKKLYITCPSCKTKSMPMPNVLFANEKPVK